MCATVVCGAGVFAVGAGALLVTGVGAHMAVASEEDRSRGALQYFAARPEVRRSALRSGALWGRGALSGLVRVATSRAYDLASRGGHGGSPPLLCNVPRSEWRNVIVNHIRSWFR